MRAPWVFRYYVISDKSTGIRDVYENSSVQVRTRLRSKLFTLSQLAMSDWREPLFKVLTDQDGLSEIRFMADNVQQRPLGFLSGEAEYTLLLWAIEKGNKFAPRKACEIALERKAAVKADRSTTDVLWFALY